MKFLFTLLLSLPLFCFAQQKQYTYCCAGNVNTGADYFDKSFSDSSTGSITIDRKQITIDGNTYVIKKKVKHNVFKTKKGFIKLVYNKGTLAQLEMLRYNTRYYYHILPESSLAVSR